MGDPFSAIGGLIIGFHRTGKMQAWGRLIASVLATAFVTFWGTWGLSIWTLHGTMPEAGPVWVGLLACANAMMAMASIVIWLWQKSEITKGIPIAYPVKVEAVAPAIDGGIALDPNKK